MDAKPKPSDQTYVHKMIGIGQVLTLVTLPVVMYFIPESRVKLTTAIDRIVFTLRWEVFSAMVVIASIMHVSNGRFNSAAFNPLSGNDKLLDFKIRFLQNTFEQFIIGFVGRIILATYLENTVQRVMPVLVVYFIISRGIFYYGYKQNHQKRALGMSMTITSHLLVYATILFCFLKDGPLYGLH